jgi:predicted lipase
MELDLKTEFEKYKTIEKTGEYSTSVAKQLALFSTLVYKTDNKHFLENALSGYTKSHFKTFDNDGTEALVVKTGTCIVLSFRGTEPTELKDILADINIIPKKSEERQGIVHSGFAEALDKIWDDVELYLDSIHASGDLVYICGHSLGGALATVAAARSKYLCQVYTYGQPRVGSKKYAKNVKSTIYRHVQGADIVPAVPLPMILYRHMGEIKVVDKKKKIVYTTSSLLNFDWIRFKLMVSSIFSKVPFLSLVKDHDISDYYDNIA